MSSISSQAIVRYLRLEESEDTAELLLPSSLCDLGIHPAAAGPARYWSYPTCDGVGWVELDAAGSLGLCDAVPSTVRDATPAREAHAMRKVRKWPVALPVANRIRPARAVWVPLPQLPACDYHAAWYEQTSFEAAVSRYRAKVITDSSAGPGTRYFYIQLTSGRYACLESRRGFPQTVIISLEVDTRAVSDHSGGKVHVRDIEEILSPMGGSFTMPAVNLFIGWTTEE